MKEYTYKDDSQVFEEVQTLTLTKKKNSKRRTRNNYLNSSIGNGIIMKFSFYSKYGRLSLSLYIYIYIYISLIYTQTKYPQKVILAIGHPKITNTHFIFSELAAVMIGDHNKIPSHICGDALQTQNCFNRERLAFG